jgi:hypothetical protein
MAIEANGRSVLPRTTRSPVENRYQAERERLLIGAAAAVGQEISGAAWSPPKEGYPSLTENDPPSAHGGHVAGADIHTTAVCGPHADPRWGGSAATRAYSRCSPATGLSCGDAVRNASHSSPVVCLPGDCPSAAARPTSGHAREEGKSPKGHVPETCSFAAAVQTAGPEVHPTGYEEKHGPPIGGDHGGRLPANQCCGANRSSDSPPVNSSEEKHGPTLARDHGGRMPTNLSCGANRSSVV